MCSVRGNGFQREQSHHVDCSNQWNRIRTSVEDQDHTNFLWFGISRYIHFEFRLIQLKIVCVLRKLTTAACSTSRASRGRYVRSITTERAAVSCPIKITQFASERKTIFVAFPTVCVRAEYSPYPAPLRPEAVERVALELPPEPW